MAEGCFKYTVRSISERLRVGASAGIDREHITWFSFEGEFVTDYPNCLDGRPAQASIEAMFFSRVYRVSGEQLTGFFRQDAEKMELRSIIAEHVLRQRNQSYLDFHRATPLERYEFLLWQATKGRAAAPPLPGHRPPSPPECHRLVPLRHSPTVVTHPQGRHVFGEIIPNIH